MATSRMGRGGGPRLAELADDQMVLDSIPVTSKLIYEPAVKTFCSVRGCRNFALTI